jgi:hypothetical protein
MAREKDAPHVAAAGDSQAQMGSGEPENQRETPEKRAEKTGDPQFFDTTIAKLVQREVEDADGKKSKEWVEVMSDNLYPGEKLKRADDEEKAAKKADRAREAREKANKDDK